MAVISQKVKTSISPQKSSDFAEIWYTNANLELNDSHVTKYDVFLKFKMADDRDIKNRFWP